MQAFQSVPTRSAPWLWKFGARVSDRQCPKDALTDGVDGFHGTESNSVVPHEPARAPFRQDADRTEYQLPPSTVSRVYVPDRQLWQGLREISVDVQRAMPGKPVGQRGQMANRVFGCAGHRALQGRRLGLQASQPQPAAATTSVATGVPPCGCHIGIKAAGSAERGLLA